MKVKLKVELDVCEGEGVALPNMYMLRKQVGMCLTTLSYVHTAVVKPDESG